MAFLRFLLIGLIAGWILGRAMRGRGFGFFGNIIVGATGSLLGGYVFGFLGLSARGALGSLAMALVGAVVFFLILSFLKPSHSRKRAQEES